MRDIPSFLGLFPVGNPEKIGEFPEKMWLEICLLMTGEIGGSSQVNN